MDSRILSSLTTPETASRDDQAEDASPLRHRVEYWAAKGLLQLLGALPHRFARILCTALASLSYWFWPRLRRVGLWNLRLAYPDWSPRERRRVLFASFQNLGRMLADFAHFPHWNRSNIEQLIIYDGYENFDRAQRQGKGLLFLTAHFGNWELGSFAHGVYGHPVHFVARRLDNPLIDSLIDRYRCLSGGQSIEKGEFARQALRALRQGESVGILMDQNMLPTEGVFVDFFGLPACTTTGPARVARKTGAPVTLGLVIWDSQLRKYRLRFEAVEWLRDDDPEKEITLNTAHFTKLLEQYIRRYPEQWLWMHRRWKTRPPGEPPVYPF
ncbi:MAG TPA: lysophospholipid acyltransferase family protein [Terriglobia bacterium]|nr:lysophospholipid acyltransferase family protein [Terriglobia bacterium]